MPAPSLERSSDMKRFLAGRRLLATLALMAVAAVPATLLGPHIVRAFTLIPNIVFFDAVSVPADHTLHLHLVNQLGTDPMEFRASINPTTPGAGSSVLGGPVILNPGEGSDQAFPFAGFAPPAGAPSVPVVVTILVSPLAGSRLSSDWSGQVASSVEIVDDKTGVQTAILGSRHIVRGGRGGAPDFCLSCN
jgi:hypothetical protein